ncbi:MAG: metallophosphoesterase [Lachnospiraceae bacterium]|nr:metallophosphoesterase [Lachnospiraceae bacterium]
MKIIHCADLHLDSKLHTHLDRVRAKRRRDELLQNFARLADYAAENAVEAVLIAGDLFDRDTVSALARGTVLSVIRTHPGIRFYYLRGNHDTGDCLRGRHTDDRQAEIPENLFLFADRWTTYAEGRDRDDGQGAVTISGIELPGENAASAYASLRLDPDRFNIVLLHGQTTGGGTGSAFRTAAEADSAFRATAGTGSVFHAATEAGSAFRAAAGTGSVFRAGTGAGNAPVIDLPSLRGKGIDYLALGHLHAWKAAPLDDRGIYCYPGCLEGRGFDECGPHGFALLDIDEQRRTMTCSFVPFARRTLYALDVDVAGCLTTAQMNDLVEGALHDAGCTAEDMADVTLLGELDVECEKDIGYLRTNLEGRFFFARLRDATALRIEPGEYLYDESLRGEFVRTVLADPSIPEEEKVQIIRCGFQAMDGEELL